MRFSPSLPLLLATFVAITSGPVQAQSTARSCVTPPPDMIGWWALDETTGSDVLDLTGYLGQPFNDGTTQQGALGSPGSPAAVAGIVDGGFAFDSIDDFVSIQHHSSLNLGTDDFTLDMWIYAEAFQDQMPLFSKIDGDVGFAVSLLRWSATEFRTQLQIGDGSVEYLHSTPFVLPLQTWAHIAVVADRATGLATFYLDGIPNGTEPIATTGSIDNGERAYIAAHPAIQSVWFTGIIDEVELFRRALTSVEILGIVQAGSDGKCKPLPPQCVAPPGGMIGWWPLDETSGSSAVDLTGFLNQPFNDGTTQQGPLGAPGSPQPVAGRVDGGFYFESIDDHVEIPHGSSLNVGSGDFTVDLWFYREDIQDLMPLFSKMSSAGGYGLSIQYAGGANFYYRLDLDDGSSSDMLLGPIHASPANTWIHLTAVVDRQNGEARLYVDGTLHATLPITITGSVDNTEPAFIAFDPTFGSVWFTGVIDEVELFDRALSAAEIDDIVQAGPAGKCKPGTTSIEDTQSPNTITSVAAYPNPASASTRVQFDLREHAHVTLQVFDVVGRLVRGLDLDAMPAGRHEVDLSTADLPGGVYVIRVSTAHGAAAFRLAIVR